MPVNVGCTVRRYHISRLALVTYAECMMRARCDVARRYTLNSQAACFVANLQSNTGVELRKRMRVLILLLAR